MRSVNATSVPCRPPRASAVCLEILLNSQLAYCALAYSTNTTTLLVQGPGEKHRSNFCDVFQVFSNATTSRTSNSSSSSTSKRPARRGILRGILTRSSSFRLFWSVKVFNANLSFEKGLTRTSASMGPCWWSSNKL